MGKPVSSRIIVLFPPLISLAQLVFPVALQELSRFKFLRGSLPNLLSNMVAIWSTVGFFEELVWRGYLMHRLVDLQGNTTRLAWVISLVASAILFGLSHAYQGLGGGIRIVTAGLLFGAAF